MLWSFEAWMSYFFILWFEWMNRFTDIWKCILNYMQYLLKWCGMDGGMWDMSLYRLNYQIILILTHWDLACQDRYLHDTEACGPFWLSVCIICLYLFTFALMRLFAYLCVLNLLASISTAGHYSVWFLFSFTKKGCWIVVQMYVWFVVVHTFLPLPVTWI